MRKYALLFCFFAFYFIPDFYLSKAEQVRQANKDASPFLCCFVVVVAVVVVVMVVAVAVDWMHMNIV